jgi:hypothetical protein
MPDLESINQPINTVYNPAGMLAFLGDLGMVGVVGAAAVAGIALVAGATVEAVKATMEWGLQLDDVMDKIGGTTEEAAGLKVIADAVGMSVDDATRALNLMGKNLENVNGELGSSGKALDELNISFKNSDGTFRSSMDIFKDVATTLTAMPDGLTKTRYEMEIFGRSGAAMNDMLRLAADGGMQKFIDQAKAMGLALSDTQVAGIERLSENMNVMKDQFTGFSVIIGSAFIPAMQGVVTWLGNMLTAVTPAIQHFGEFLGILLGVQGASGAAGGAVAAASGGGGAPTGYKELINYNFWANQPHPAGAVNPYAAPGGTGGGGSMGVPAGGSALQGHGQSFQMTGFELAVKQFVDGIKAVPWAQVGKDFAAGGKAVHDAMVYVDTHILHPAQTLTNSPGFMTTPQLISFTNQSGLDFGKTLRGSIAEFFQPKFDDQWKKDADAKLAYITAMNETRKAAEDSKTTNAQLRTAVINLPGQIKSAMAMSKK